jgi:hypothetical protein
MTSCPSGYYPNGNEHLLCMNDDKIVFTVEMISKIDAACQSWCFFRRAFF